VNINSVNLVYFSPTQTTKQVLEGIAQGIQSNGATHVDLTLPHTNTQEFVPVNASLTLIGAPVYGGRLPADAAQRLRQVKGRGIPAVVVVVYGNRAYEDALLELKDLVTECGFVPIAGAAFIGEHSYSTDAMPIAPGRPDTADVEKAVAFGQQIREKMATFSPDIIPSLTVPGNVPYKQGMRSSEEAPPAPVTHTDLCTLCGQCAEVCPTGAIAVGETVITDARACILCCACTRACPTGARVMEDPRVLRTAAWLYREHSARKEPEVFL